MSIRCFMLFAAGIGSRMGGETPKPLVKIMGRSFLYRALDYITSIESIELVVINTYWKHEVIEEAVALYIASMRMRNNKKIIVVTEEERLETGGGLKSVAIEYFENENFVATMNCDAIIASHYDPFSVLMGSYEFYSASCVDVDAILLICNIKNVVGYVVRDFAFEKNGRLLISSNGDYIYTGMQIIKLKPILENPKKAFSLSEHYIRSTKLFGAYIETKFYHANTKADIVAIESYEKAHKYLRD